MMVIDALQRQYMSNSHDSSQTMLKASENSFYHILANKDDDEKCFSL